MDTVSSFRTQHPESHDLLTIVALTSQLSELDPRIKGWGPRAAMESDETDGVRAFLQHVAGIVFVNGPQRGRWPSRVTPDPRT